MLTCSIVYMVAFLKKCSGETVLFKKDIEAVYFTELESIGRNQDIVLGLVPFSVSLI